jgi:phage gp29-like protein
LCGIIEEYLIKPLVDYNFGVQDKYPQFVFEPLTKEEFLDLSKVFAILVRNGVVGADETWMRDMLRVPKRSEATISTITGEVGTGEEAVPIPPADTKIIKTEGGGAVIASPKNKRTVGKPTQQIKTPKTSRSSGMK